MDNSHAKTFFPCDPAASAHELDGRSDSTPAEWPTGADGIIGRCPALQEVYHTIGRIAPKDITVLILGETGTGKELVARALHQYSQRRTGPFVAINCAAIPEGLLESELFGHERGAFTGATRHRIGRFEQAQEGTIFLDEVGDMDPAAQAKLLRLLQDRCFERLGSNATIRANVRVIASTNQDLQVSMASGRFRPDLFYRLNGFTLSLPPLRDRGPDLALLVEYFRTRLNHELGTDVRFLTAEALRVLESYSWPGNVRELQSVIRYALIHANGDVLGPESLPAYLHRSTASASSTDNPRFFEPVQFVRQLLAAGATDIYDKVIAAIDQIVLSEVLQHTGGNQRQACALLGVARNTLRIKLQSLNLVAVPCPKRWPSEFAADRVSEGEPRWRAPDGVT
jgi:two-component system nitrogen regulation response regulator GlnG